jgi:hypothetical protein
MFEYFELIYETTSHESVVIQITVNILPKSTHLLVFFHIISKIILLKDTRHNTDITK